MTYEWAELKRRKEEMFYANLPLMKAVPEVLEHIEAQHGLIPFAVVSGFHYVFWTSRLLNEDRQQRESGQ